MSEKLICPSPDDPLALGNAQRRSVKTPESLIRPYPQPKTNKHKGNPRPTDDNVFVQAANLKSIQYWGNDQSQDGDEERLADQPRTTSIILLGSQVFGLFTLPHCAL